ncbi:MAG: carboxypeptidase-like regulatory domain-containing protein [Acidobacteriota bacterium]|nr:carboxypeptidase-like regulatory domain-containing protein [Acidobacteriota bacterium]
MLTEKSKIAPAIVLAVCILAFNHSAKAQQTALGKVIEYVFDRQDAVILGEEVIIENANFRKSVLPNDDGKYEVQLPAGVYSITTKQGTFYSLKRAVFSVESNETVTINIRPTYRILAIFLKVTSKGVREPAEYAAKPNYEEFMPFFNSPLNVVIEYQKRKRKGLITEYRNVKFSYNKQTIYADVLRLNKKSLSIEAEGNVIGDENAQRQSKQKANLQIVEVEAK